MLVYVATYPRCGAALLRDTIALNWGYATANLYTSVQWPAELSIKSTSNPALISYQCEGQPSRMMLASPCRQTLTPELRAVLAADPELFFVKTHERPPADPIAGEIAVQLVRHPAGAISSQHRLHQKYHETTPCLAHFSEGSDTGGRWDQYHQAWGASELPLMRLRFEDVVVRPLDLVEALSDFLGLPMPEAPKGMSAQAAHERNPYRNPITGPNGWMEQITAGEALRIWNRHKLVAKLFGYHMHGIAAPFTSPERRNTLQHQVLLA